MENHNYLGTEYYPQIIETELFERVQKRREQIRADGGKGSHRPGRDVRILFGGVITCAECGAVYSHIQPHDKKRASGIPKWKCKNYVYQNRLTCAGGVIVNKKVPLLSEKIPHLFLSIYRREFPPIKFWL